MTESFFFKKRPFAWLTLGAVVLLLLVSYRNFAVQAARLSGQLFDLAENVSWRQSDGHLFRWETRSNIEDILLTKRSWKDFVLSTQIFDPRDSAFIYNYQDKKNFDFIIFEPQNSWVFWGAQRDNKYTILKKVKFEFTPVVLCLLKGVDNRAELFLNGRLHSAVEAPVRTGKIGLMSKSVGFPPTVFKDVVIEDKSGRYANAQVFEPLTVRHKKFHAFIFAAGLLIFAVALAVFYLPPFFNTLRREGKVYAFLAKCEENPLAAYAWHLVAALFIFWPFWTKGDILVSSSDNFGQIYPLFIFSYHNFWNILDGLGGNLWNPYSHNGLPFFSNHWNMTYYPLNWPLFFLPEKWLLWGLTLRALAETFLLGVLSYKIFRKEFGNNSWALFCSVVYQLCSMLIFTFSIFPVTALMFCLTLYLYLLWSMDTRKPYGNYFYITLSVILFLTSANMAFIFYGGLVLITLTLYRLLSLRLNERKKAGLTVGAGLLTGFLIAAVRIIPCVIGVAGSNRLVEDFYTIHERLAMALRLFIPQIVGWLGHDFLNALTSPNLNLIFRSIDLPSNSQNTFFVYFGVVSALIFLFGLFLKRPGPGRFWIIYALIALALGLMFQPFWGIFNILFFPFNHYSYYIVIIPIGFCAFLGYAGMQIEKQKEDLEAKLPVFILVILLVQAYALVFVTYLFPGLASVSRIAFLVMAVWYLVYRYAKKNNVKWQEAFFGLSLLIVSSVVFAAVLAATTAFFMEPIPKKREVMALLNIPTLIFLFIIAQVLFGYLIPFRDGKQWRLAGLSGFIAIFLALAFGFFALQDWLRALAAPERNYFIDFIFGEGKFVLVVLIFLSLLVLYGRNRLSRSAFWGILFFVTLIDLLGFNARFDNVVAPSPHGKAFYPLVYPYRDIEPPVKRELDLSNYRAHYLHQAGLQANENLIFKVPSYSGIMGHMPKRFSDFLVNFGYPEETVLVYPSESTDNERFLDLCAVKYKFLNRGQYETRPAPLARMNLFSSFEVIQNDTEILTRLKDPGFDPSSAVILNERLVSEPAGRSKTVMVRVNQNSADQVTAEVDNPWGKTAVLLFNETFSSGWKAYVDGKKAPVVLANYTFMAVAVEPGRHSVRFVYAPGIFYLTRNLSLVALILFLGMSLFFWIKGSKS